MLLVFWTYLIVLRIGTTFRVVGSVLKHARTEVEKTWEEVEAHKAIGPSAGHLSGDPSGDRMESD